MAVTAWAGGQASGGTPTPTPTLAVFANAIAAARSANSGMIPLLHWGDSTTHGFGGGTGGTSRTAAFNNSYPKKMAAALATGALSDFRHSTDAVMSTSNEATTTYPTYDPRVGYTTGVQSGSGVTLGGLLFQIQSSGVFSFTPEQDFDTVVVLYATDVSANNGIGSVRVGSGASLGTFNCNQTDSVQALVLSNVHGTGAPGTGTINITRTSATNVFIVGVLAYNSTVKTILHINAGWGGSTAAQNSAQAKGYNPRAVLSLISPKMTILNLGINDRRTGITPSAFKADMQLLATAAKVSGDIAFINPWSSAIASASQAAQDAYTPIYSQLASENAGQVYDLYTYYGPYTTWNPTFGFNDNLHPNIAGYADEALYLKPLLLNGVAG